MRGFWFLLFLLCAVLCCVIGSHATGPGSLMADQGVPKVPVAACEQCPLKGQCTIEVPYVAEVPKMKVASCEAGVNRPVLAVAGRSVGAVGRVAVAPVRLVGKIVKAKPARKLLKGVARVKPARRAAAGVARLICPRRRGCRN